jgi:hypothetical protein
MKRNRMAAVGLLLAMTCRSRTSMAAGENLVPNGTFDTDLSNWTTEDGYAPVWSPDDADYAPDSGSGVVGSDTVLTSGPRLYSACIPVSGGGTYELSAAGTWVEGETLYFTRLHLIVAWWAGTDCGDVDTELARETIGWSGRIWERRTQFVSAPADAASAEVQLEVRTAYVEGPVEAHFDNVVLEPIDCQERCGDPIAYVAERSRATPSVVSASDAFFILHGSVGSLACPLCVCDVNDSGTVTAVDALFTLAAAAGGPVSLTCPQ